VSLLSTAAVASSSAAVVPASSRFAACAKSSVPGYEPEVEKWKCAMPVCYNTVFEDSPPLSDWTTWSYASGAADHFCPTHSAAVEGATTRERQIARGDFGPNGRYYY
jgi:hypothetical protein